ncbi:hypothetical protein AN477_08560 [Alicyclobacillus ferrooxydans]|uniref:Uncharacterized protein n=1 Tax=Alicyclobacillus ferrooxydans TaxID=471514 RepID=A0A0P9CMD5_9BACL|nr:hypothetical protein AN477_08560 [Alicyclobacillus ferrooxydans]
MILWNAWTETLWSYTFYFSHGIIVLLSIPTAVVRPIQVLYKGKLRGLLAPFELLVELIRLFQYCVILTLGLDLPLQSLFDSALWGRFVSIIRHLHWGQVAYQLCGFVIVFAVINIILFMIIIRKSTVANLLEKYKNKTKTLSNFEVSSVRTAAMLAVKNMLVIPVSVIYLLHIFNLI